MVSKQWFPSILELAIVCVVGMTMIFLSHQIKGSGGVPSQQMRTAAETMQSATEILVAYREENGPSIDPSTDINGTGLIGAFFTQITTTTGNLEAKRTSTNPNMAALITALLVEAGVQAGDFIAVGASGSFPALLLATAAAAEALNLQVGLILSLGSSQFGANIPEFTWIEMERALAHAELLSLVPVAVSFGGDLDIAQDLSSDTRELLQMKIDEAALHLIHESNLSDNVRQRMLIYREASEGGQIAAFVNIGGAWANMGVDASILSSPPGLIHPDDLADEKLHGVIHAMDDAGVPVIHLLNMRDLVMRYGLPWDPSPLPIPGEDLAGVEGAPFIQAWVSVLYLILVLIWLVTVVLRRRAHKIRDKAIQEY